MSVSYGWAGKVLRVNLSEKTTAIEPLNLEVAQKFIGSRGLGVKTFIDEVDPKVDALSEENKLPIIVFDMNKEGNLTKVVSGENIGTLVNIK